MKLKIYIKTYSIVALTLSTFQGTERNLKLRGVGSFYLFLTLRKAKTICLLCVILNKIDTRTVH